MNRSRTSRAAKRALLLSITLLSACDGALSDGPARSDSGVRGDGALDPSTTCTEARPYFESTAWPEVFSRCAACHVPGGPSGGTRFVLRPLTVDGAIRTNFDIVRAATALRQGDQPLLALKPTQMVPHAGGLVIEPGSAQHDILLRTLELIATDPTCGSVTPPAPVTEGLVLLDELGTLRKASLQIAGRIPTEDERQRVREGSWAALDTILDEQMREPAFHTRVMEIFGDVLLTDRSLNALSQGAVITRLPDGLFPDREYAGVPWEDPGRRVDDALAREPLEMIAHIVDEGRPLTEIVTARYRMVNPLSAPVYSLTPAFVDPTDPNEWVEVEIPEMHCDGGTCEYAGVLTTPAFLRVVEAMASNRNRRRARYVYQWFLDHDVMRTASRIDFSTVDFSSAPWRNDARCTGCHTQIDPVAGLFQNWTNCYDSGGFRYFPRDMRYCGSGDGWYTNEEMYSPGLPFGGRVVADQTELGEGLVVLGDSIAADPGFARAMARHVFRGLTGHQTQDPPQNTADPAYPALQAAYDAERHMLEELGASFAAHHFDTRWLVREIVRSEPFRAVSADEPGREELVGMGGGSLVTPELLHRRIASVLGLGWGVADAATLEDAPSESPYYLLAFDELRLHAGGIDYSGTSTRLERPSGLSAAVSTRMAYEMSCHATARDFARPTAERLLFPLVERTLAPSGDATAADQEPILRNLQHLHDRVLGETLALDDPELLASYALLVDAHAALASEGTDLGPCGSSTDPATGAPWPGGFDDDPSRSVRAWQAVLAYLLSDYLFLFE